MSNKTRNLLKIISIILVLLTVTLHFGFIRITFVDLSSFWMLVGAYVLLLISSK